jgi:DnaJ-class molecular chaperone
MEATSGQGGKGDTPRPINKERYDRNYLRIYGKICPNCKGQGGFRITNPEGQLVGVKGCKNCEGLGYVEDK